MFNYIMIITATVSFSIFSQANESFTTVYSGGRDRRVWATDIRLPENRVLICEETAPVLKVILIAMSNQKKSHRSSDSNKMHSKDCLILA